MKLHSCIHTISFFFIYFITSDTYCNPMPKNESRHGNTTDNGNSSLGKPKAGACSNNQWMTWEQGSGQSSTFGKNELAETDNLYTLYNNVYNAGQVKQGSRQETQCLSYEKGVLSWMTKFQFYLYSTGNPTSVLSYSNIRLKPSKTIQLQDLKKFKTSWDWKLSDQTDDLVTNVAYDVFTSLKSDCEGQGGGCASHEIMIWLAAINGAAPIGKFTGKTVKIGSKYEFDVWSGPGPDNLAVISLYPKKTQYKTFDADLKQLFTNDLKQFGLKSEEYITTIGAGPEPFKGGAKITTSKYTLDVY
ncbi:endoglucanase [Phakopsora pachyrhizi]|uniref:Endoglucanase n=1 Tax=Phakopsora pachyrhizi TaxID=170000 RepID=A0AAV0B1D0_PHAPC|nr:endoglucanase [Phakopsora pachyrhizi]